MQQNLACRLAHGNKAEGRENTKLSKPRIQTLIYLTIICTCNCGNHPGSQPRQPTLTSLVFQLSDNTISDMNTICISSHAKYVMWTQLIE
ncbi:uncharacterized protein ACN2A1_014766 isoform 3-T8 [Glossina fuscipes fuscipes]